MATNQENPIRGTANTAKSTARAAENTELVDRLVRVGYFARGIVYGLIGYLAFQAALNGSGKITDQRGALATIADKPFGKWVLIVVAIGLVGLFIWGIIRAVADPMHEGSDTKGLVKRAGYLVSGLAYGLLLVPTMNLIRGAGSAGPSSGQTAQRAAAGIMAHPWGVFLVGLIGLILIGVGVGRIIDGYNAKFHERFKGYKMSAQEREWAVRMGRFGYIALGIVFVIIGFLTVWAATTKNPARVSGWDGALLFLAHQPYGPLLLAIVALGLIAFAVYSFMGAFWFRVKTNQ